MFGFLQAPRADCCGRAPGLWRGHFCGLATRMSHDFGPWSRFLINRDATFLALAATMKEDHPPRWGTCCNPLAQPRLLYDHAPGVAYAADVTLCALGVKLQDDAGDESGLRRLAARIGKISLAPALDKAIARLNSQGFPTAEVSTTILSQTSIEQDNPDARQAAAATAQAYGEIFAFTQKESPEETRMRSIGQSLGRLIYWDDAWRDWPEDRKRSRYNPLQRTPPPELRSLMESEHDSLAREVSLLPPHPQQSVLAQVVAQTRKHLPRATEDPAKTEKKRRRAERRSRDERRCDWCYFCDGDCCSCSSGGFACGFCD
ncbi:DUF5685 family protein [Roseibacillus ishigakijimensis]|uniref:Uncharacterized protein n=1 Tax=Roseibacillus ishigakijimensis TaxID=454146 RepID=A0A934RUF9_9BACT|nr:DUF5685 family protein [Roseibacillus ishigakijimensis]MBK1834375.1 hypothetical protein [Roseibacillus ishigakijimensis]